MVHEGSDWQELLDSLTKHFVKNGRIKEFYQIRNDNARRIKFLLEDEDLRGILLRWMNYRLKREISLSSARSLREAGNKLFSAKDFGACVETYSQSILSCPCEHPEESSVAYANRSAALFQLELYEDCIRDIETALENSYPENLIPKLLLRKVKSLKKLGMSEDSEAVMRKLEVAMENMLLADKRKIETEISHLKRGEEAPEEVQDINNVLAGLPEPFCGQHLDFKGASAALDVRHTLDLGRFVVANRDIKAGETLFVEEPRALVVLPDFQSSRCHHCTYTMSKRYPCLRCGKVWFCSQICREQAHIYHESECGLESVLNAVGIAHLGLRVVLTFGLETVLSFLRNPELLHKLPGINSPYDTRGYPVLYHLVSHTETLAAEELFQYALTAACLTVLMEEHTTFFRNHPERDDHYSIGAVILVHVCQMVCNAHAITELCPVGDDGERQERVATAIYPSASLMNHSCDPSVINSFQGNRLIVRAIRDVKTGGEVFNCYGPHYRRMSRRERQEALQAQYGFTCQCPPCSDADTEDFQDVIYSFQCPSCRGSLVNPKVQNSQNQMTTCRSCKKPQSYFPQLQADLEAVSLDARGTEAMDQGDVVQAIKFFTKCVQLRSRALYKAHPDLGRSADKLAQCYAFMGKYEECEKYLRMSLTAVEERYGRYSIEMGNELQKFTDILLELAPARDQRAREELAKCLDDVLLIFKIHYGPWSSSYKEVLQKKSRLAELLVVQP